MGQNLVVRLKARGFTDLVVLDKHPENTAILRTLHPDIEVHLADLAEDGVWKHYFKDADAVVILAAQIGAKDLAPFTRNNITATHQVIDAIKRHGVPYAVHISSSVVDSVGLDHYTQTKREQEEIVVASGIRCVVLRPTLMFGWFDRKHFGWLARFMKRVPVFPIPGHGRYMRQPLYVGDFCNVIIRCLETRPAGQTCNITGLQEISYIDIIRAIKRIIGARTLIVRIPYALFAVLLNVWAWFDKEPPFTEEQLQALVAGDKFDVIDWPGLFGVEPTPLAAALEETFQHPVMSAIELHF